VIKGAAMTTLLAIGLTNALAATVLAILVWGVTRVWREPVVAQLLWILVLVKVVTPPLVSIPWSYERQPQNIIVSLETTTAIKQHIASAANETTMPTLKPKLARTDNDRMGVPAVRQIEPRLGESLRWEAIAITAWLVGSLVWLLTAAVRLTRFHRALRKTKDCPPDLGRMAHDVAAKLGVTGRFQLRMTEARLSPLVWPIGRPTILLSRPLLAELSAEEIETLLAHELAHLKRRDHWLRWFEMFVTTFYWWHPVLWWTRRMIHKAEEQACDAWVVWVFPDATKRYASALFKVIQMVSEQRASAPLVASQLGSTGNLKERIEDIMNATWKCRLTKPARIACLCSAVLILPFSLQIIRAGENSSVAAEQPAAKRDAPNTSTSRSPATWTDDSRSVEHAGVEEVAALKEHVQFLKDQFTRIDELNRIGARGGSAEARALAGYELAAAQADLALAEGHHDELVAHCREAQQFAEENMKAVMASFDAGRVSLQLLMETARNLSDSKRRLIHARGPQRPDTQQTEPPTDDRAALKRELAQHSSVSEFNTSASVWRKLVESRKLQYDRMKVLADKKVVPTADLETSKTEYEICVAQYEHALRTLKYAQLLVELAQTEYDEALAKNKAAPNSVSEFELKKLKIKVELAKVKASEVE
jgi:beta-lactamase regulating signal transducer with metallopeptidase domain